VIIAVSHVDQPDTINANFITALDSFTVPPGGSVGRFSLDGAAGR
jgi:hypothetical protein